MKPKSVSGTIRLPAQSGTLLERLRQQGYSVRADCGGQGACGRCQVRFISAPPAPDETEMDLFSSLDLDRGRRLACRVEIEEEVILEYQSDWEIHFQVESLAVPTHQSLGIAVDIGTTGLVLALVDLNSGCPIKIARGFNPQRAWGADVMTRLVAARDPAALVQMQECLLKAMMAGKEILSADLLPTQHLLTDKFLAVGNTAMLHLATGIPEETLSVFPFRSPLEEQRLIPLDWNQASYPLAGPLQSFIGSDHLAVLEYLQPHRQDSDPTLIMDLGTNSEIALWDGKNYWATSCAAGPAFEGGGLSCGAPAGPEVATGVEIGNESVRLLPPIPEKMSGLCGSALISLLASLRRGGRLSSAGRLQEGQSVRLQEAPLLALTQKDIRALQLAKGAIHAGIILLARTANLPLQKISKIVITGAFARSLQTEDLKEIGLIPALTQEISFVNDGALFGAAQALATSIEPFSALRPLIRVINLVEEADFQERFIEGLELKPMED